MEKAEYQKHFELEESFWWFRGRRKILGAVLASRLRDDRERRCLDVGCGAGLNLKALSAFGEAYGCDVSADALFFTKQRGAARLTRCDARALPYREGSFGLVSLLDVLSHESISDDGEVLKEAFRIIAPGGFLLVSDNALPILSSPHDRAYHVRERYRRRDLAGRLERAGFEVVRTTYFNFFLFPAVFAVRVAKRLRDRDGDRIASDVAPVHPALNRLLLGFLRLEARLARRVRLPIGSSVVCLARKK